jgi:hypothetical protein
MTVQLIEELWRVFIGDGRVLWDETPHKWLPSLNMM